jgi:hypothetical protein
MTAMPNPQPVQRAIIYLRESDARMYNMLNSQRAACRE